MARIMKKKLLLSIAVSVVLSGSGFLSAPLLAMPHAERMELPNRLVVLFVEEHSLPAVTLQLLINAGARCDPQGAEGLANQTARALLLGTSLHTAAAIDEKIDFMGASFNALTTRDYSMLNMRVLKKDLDQGFSLFMEVLTQPEFPQQEIRRELEKTKAAIQAAEDQPLEVAEKAFRRTLFPASSYGHPVEGTRQSLDAITRDAVQQFYRDYYHANNAILAVVGDITAAELKTRLVPLLAAWPLAKVPRTRPAGEPMDTQQTVLINRGLTQANIIIGNAGVNRGNPDYYALTVMNYILGGGGFASALVEEIRNKRGLAYSVASFFDAGKYQGSFQIVLQTKNPSAREAISLALQQMELMRTRSVSEQQLRAAKSYLTGSFPLRLDTQEKLATFFSQVEYYNLCMDYPEKYPELINRVTAQDVLRVAKTYLHPEKYILVVVADLKQTGMKL
jgi:zinc protease